jgi:RimJ/RimL family protein N-acetyltransferase
MLAALADDRDGRTYTYLGYEPFADVAAVRRMFAGHAVSEDPLFFAIVIDAACVGIASLLRIEPEVGVVEVGHIHYTPRLQRTRAATEAMYLLMRKVFELGYRRYEWKCDSLNEASRRAAARYGFTYEGTFRQARVYKGRNRDTAWFSIIDKEWPALAAEYERWLNPSNFDGEGRQKTALKCGGARPSP